jgi:hypothetical protein
MVPQLWVSPTASAIVTTNESIQPTHPEKPAQETAHPVYGYGQFQAFHQAHEDYVHGRLNNVEIQGSTCSQQTIAPSLVLADYSLGDETFRDLRTIPTRFPTHPVPVSKLESTIVRATNSAAPLQASSPKVTRAKRNALNKNTQLLKSSIENTEDATMLYAHVVDG